ncbi:MAG: class I SAM-dependent rRNA methyltransferase [Fimbriiglobus sp.]
MIPKVILKPKKAMPFYARHPWVFVGAIDRVEGEPTDGAEVGLFSTTGNFIAKGFFNSQSKIRVRLYSWQESESLDEEFFRRRIRSAISLRRDWLKLDHGPTSAYRAVFSESDGLSGLVVDRFADYATAQFTGLGIAAHREAIGKILMEELAVRGVYLRTEKGIAQLEGLTLTDGLLVGELPPEEILIEENGLKIAVNLTEGQKTGYYLDQRDNRSFVAKLCRGKRVLDAYCYSGGFGLYATQAGAVEVESVDGSEKALQLAARNAELNGLPQIQRVQADVFKHLDSLVQSQRQFDVIVLDPPKFARSQSMLPAAMNGYRRLITLALKLLPADGVLVMCCCTGVVSQEMLEDVLSQTANEAKRDLQILERRGPAADHPVAAACRETTYLKCLVCRVR